MLWRLKQKNQRWRIYDNFLISENRWRAQRYGVGAGLIDFGKRELVDFAYLVEEMIDLVREDAEVLGCLAEVEGARAVLVSGSSADRQRAVFTDSIQADKPVDEALRDVVRHLIEEYHTDL